MPRVSIITRTKDRPLLLKRAALSVRCQTFSDYEWVVVNDGGSEAVLAEVLQESQLDHSILRLVSLESSLGMEAASNAGIAASKAEFICIHDDDDSWDPLFLEEAVAFLEKADNRRFGGVVCGSIHVSEEVRGSEVIEHGRWSFFDFKQPIALPHLLAGNLFPPISFLFRRSVYDQVGGFDASLPVMGDWAFNLDFLMISDIGVLERPLAYYHHRDRGGGACSAYSNSVIGGSGLHMNFRPIILNRFMRRHCCKSPSALVGVLGQLFDRQFKSVCNVRSSAEHLSASYDASGSRDWVSFDNTWSIGWLNVAISQMGLIQRLLRRVPRVLRLDEEWRVVRKCILRLKVSVVTPANFCEVTYLSDNPDVGFAVKNGKIQSAYMHYILDGRDEGRRRASAKRV